MTNPSEPQLTSNPRSYHATLFALDVGEMATYRLRTDALSWELVEEELVVADLKSSRILGLNPTGTLLWQELETGASREALVGVLTEQFGVSVQLASSDVDDFLVELAKRGLLVEY